MAAVTVYTTPGCVQCNATFRALDSAGIDYQVINLAADAEAHTYITEELGHRQAPVVVTEDQHWSGFRPDLISGLAA